MCNVSRTRYVLNIWKRVAHLQNEKALVSLNISCQHKVQELRYKLPSILHILSVILLILYFYVKHLVTTLASM